MWACVSPPSACLEELPQWLQRWKGESRRLLCALASLPGVCQVFQTDVGQVLPASRTPAAWHRFSFSGALTFGSPPEAGSQCFIGHMNSGIFRLNNRNSSPKLLTLLSWHSLRMVSQCECREKKRTSDQVTVLGPWCDALVLSPNSSYSVSSRYSVSFVKWVHWLKCLWGLLNEMNQSSNGQYKHCYVIFFPEERGTNV